MVRILSDDDVAAVLDLPDLLPVLADAFVAQAEGRVERPDRPHFPVGEGIEDGPLGTGLTMPAYVHGSPCYATKLASVHEGNAARDLPTINAQIALTDAATGRPVAFLAGTRLTNARTGCIGGLAVDALASGPVDLAVIGAGTQARWQTRAIAAAADLDRVRVHSPSDSRERCATDLREELDCPVTAVETPAAAVEGASVVVTATTSEEPVFPGDALDPGALVVAIGAFSPEMRELDDRTVERAGRVIADVPEEAIETGDLRSSGLAAEDLVPLGEVLAGRVDCGGGLLVVASVGSAVLDAAAATHVYEAARDVGRGTDVSL
jgi:alanine dehydrogenase